MTRGRKAALLGAVSVWVAGVASGLYVVLYKRSAFLSLLLFGLALLCAGVGGAVLRNIADRMERHHDA